MTDSVEGAMRLFRPSLPMAVAYSGGADSTALLVASVRKWPGLVHAWHVNHGLQAAAAQFEAGCRTLCDSLDVPLTVVRVDASPAAGQSPEDAARKARYKAFSGLALAPHAGVAIKTIALGQHANDQVETLLLALSRGAGLAGISAMPRTWLRDGLVFHRPFLGVSGQDIRTWLDGQGITFCEDPSNQDMRYTRNKIRSTVMPALADVFPQFLETFARSSEHAAQGQMLLEELALQDLSSAVDAEGLISIKVVQQLSLARQSNLLRYWLNARWAVVPSTAQLLELRSQIVACVTRGHRIHIKVGEGFVTRKGPVLTWYNP